MSEQQIVLVAALGRNRVIGHEGRMPWHLPADLQHFKAVTMGHPLVMGRKTFEAVGRALPGRTSIVISRGAPELPGEVILAHTPAEALARAGEGPVMVIGGGEIYRQLLPRATRMELTWVDAEPVGDAVFPEWNEDEWRLERMEVRQPDEKNAYRLVFCSMVRK